MVDLKNLKMKIEILREALYDAIENNKKLSSDKVLEISKQLDDVISQFNNLNTMEK